MRLQLNIFVFLFFILCASFSVQAQFTPYFQNFSLSEYNAGNQNWGISRDESGLLYVANNNGLLEYDGLKWYFFELPNKTTIRSVLAYKGLVFTGSYEEFGYWKKNSKGTLIYNSLSDLVKKDISPNEEIWEILSFKEGIIFRSFQNIYLYKFDDGIKKIKPSSTVISCSSVDDTLYISTLKDGIFELKNDVLVSKIKSPILENTKVLSIVKYKGKLLIMTSLKGCFVFYNNNLHPIDFNVNELIEQHLLNGFSKLDNGNMVFGTIKDGVYVTDDKGTVKFHVSKENGLINNTVLSQYLDYENKLWLGLDNGIAYIDLNSHNYFFNDVSGRLGAVYDVIKFKGVIYLGSNTGLFYLNKQNKLEFVKGSQGQVWNLNEIDGELFCGHNEGTFLVEDYKIKKISSITGGYVIKKAPEKSNIYIQGTYTGLVRFKKENSYWNVKRFSEPIMPIKYLVFEDQRTAWAAHAYKGLYKITFDNDYDSIINVENYNSKGRFSDFNIRVYKIKNDIFFKTNDGWLTYRPILDSIVPSKLLNDNFGKDSYIISEDGVDPLALKKPYDAISFKSLLKKGDREISLSNNNFENRLIVGNENVSKISDSTFALNLNNGFMLIDASSHLKVKLYKPTIDKIEIDKRLIDLQLNNKQLEINLKSSFGVSVSSPKSNSHFFEYAILELDSTKWKKLDKNHLELSNLKDGTYTILVRTSNYLGNSSDSCKIKLHVLPPWYKNTTGIILYVLVIVLGFTAFYYVNKGKVTREQRLLKIKFAREQQEILRKKTLENEKRIVQLKNETLKNEIKLKSKQLANTAMALVKKNETLQEIKKELNHNKDSFDNVYAYKKLLKKIDSSIAHRDEWEIFEYNFNQVHEDFFTGLKAKHPKLTPKDLKICAYIKMNLTTKEIAPLLNVSVRGLETHRYRLKKKLKLADDISLANYLINFE